MRFIKKLLLYTVLLSFILFTASSCMQAEKEEPSPEFLSTASGRIAFVSQEGLLSQIYVMNDDGTSRINLSDNDFNEFSLAWSPDGQEIAFTSDSFGRGQIHKANADGSGRANLSDNDLWEGYPAWSPDGQEIAFVSGKIQMIEGQVDIFGQIWVMDADGTNKRNLTTEISNDWHPCWSPDGQRIAFVSYEDSTPQIYVMDADGSGRVNLSDNDLNESHPSWSPDGQKIAFISYKGPIPQIYVMDADGSGRVNLSDSDLDELYPVWSPDS